MGSKINVAGAATFLLAVLLTTAFQAHGATFNVQHTGAKANGNSDDSQVIARLRSEQENFVASSVYGNTWKALLTGTHGIVEHDHDILFHIDHDI